MSAADPATEEDFFLPGSTAQLGLASSDLDESWDSRDVRTSVDLTMDDNNPLPPGRVSEFKIGYVAAPARCPPLTPLRWAVRLLGGSRTDRCISVSYNAFAASGEVAAAAVYSCVARCKQVKTRRSCHTRRSFFLPGSGASRGLTSQDLEVSRTDTWDDNTVTIDEVEKPGEPASLLLQIRWAAAKLASYARHPVQPALHLQPAAKELPCTSS